MMRTKTRDETYTVSAKGKRFQDTGFCSYCYKDVKLGAKGQCFICNAKVKRKSTNEKLIRTFEKLCVDHREVLQSWIPTTHETQQLFVKVKIGFYTYFVSIRYLQEFQNITSCDRDSKQHVVDNYNKFLQHIQKTCPRIAF